MPDAFPNKKVLIISYYWPPSGGVSVLRSLKFVKYLPAHHWTPIVYVPSNPQYDLLDEDNLRQIPPEIQVLKKPILEPFRLFKWLSGRRKTDAANPVYLSHKKKSFIDRLSIWIRGNFFIPDARCLWIKPSVRFLLRYLKENPVDAILTDGPPHTNTVIAMRLAQKTGIPWLADFQDPWTQVDYYKMLSIGKWADARHRRLEQECFKTATKITIASPSWKKDLESIGASNVDVLYYGYDEEDFTESKTEQNQIFTILHSGVLGEDRLPLSLFEALSQLKLEMPELAGNFKLIFQGQCHYALKELTEQYHLNVETTFEGFVPRKTAIRSMISADLLLLLLNQAENAKGRIPGKFYEYLRSGNEILSLGPADSDVGAMLGELSAGRCIDYNDLQGIKLFLKNKFNQHKKKKEERFIHTPELTKYDVRHQVGNLANWLNEITSITNEK
jgi:glycosyltransferase involved in cell wall biosynthesis